MPTVPPVPMAFATRAVLVLTLLVIGATYLLRSLRPVSPAQAVIAVLPPEAAEARSTALILTDAADWQGRMQARAERLTGLHTLVIALDAAALLADRRLDCDSLGPSLARLAQELQTEAGQIPRSPVLVGSGQGAALAQLAARAGPTRFKGLVTLAAPPHGFCPEGAPQGNKAPLRWLDLADPATPSPARGLAGATVVDPGPDPEQSFTQAYLRLAGTDSAFARGQGAAEASLADLPITLHRAEGVAASGTYAIFLSGDGGWARFDAEVANRLAAAGIPTVGLSSLRYLWQEKSPQRIAADLARIDAHYRHSLGAERVLILGFSMGANVLPFAAPHLPQAMQRDLAALALLAPETRTGFEIVVGGWLGQASGAQPVAPQIEAAARTLSVPVLCLHGSKEKVSACPEAEAASLRTHLFEGGHHLGKDYDRVAQILISAARAADLARN